MPPAFPRPIFILTAPGLPGQTLAAALAQGGLAYDVPEQNLILGETVDSTLRNLTGLRASQLHGVLRTLAQLLAGEQTQPAVEMARRWLMSRSWMTSAGASREIAALAAPRRIATPVTAAIFDLTGMRRLRETFPDAVYVHLTAHPHLYGRLITTGLVGEISMKLTGAMEDMAGGRMPEPQKLWLEVEEALAEFEGRLPEGGLIRFRIEDLVADPRSALRELARRLELPCDDAAVDAMMQPERSAFAGPGPMGAHTPGAIQPIAAVLSEMPDPARSEMAGSLPWRLDGQGFVEPVVTRARLLGYEDAPAAETASPAEAEVEQNG